MVLADYTNLGDPRGFSWWLTGVEQRDETLLLEIIAPAPNFTYVTCNIWRDFKESGREVLQQKDVQ